MRVGMEKNRKQVKPKKTCLNYLSILKEHELLAAATCFMAGPNHSRCGAACSVTGIQTEPTYPYRGV